MHSISNNILRFLSLASISLLLAFSFSCKKEETEPTPSGGSGGSGNNSEHPILATADINYITDGDVESFKSHKEGNNIIINKDTTLMMNFNPVDENGNDTDGSSIGLIINDSFGIHEGAEYTIPGNNTVQVVLDKNIVTEPSIYLAQGNNGTATIKITSLTENHIKGTFEFTVILPSNQNTKEAKVTNGKFESDIIRL